MPKPLTRNQRLANADFLAALRRSGNIRLAARETGIAYGTIQHRRAAHPIFARAIVAAQAFAQARLHTRGGARRPEPARDAVAASDPHRTAGGEPVVIRRNDGTLQLRRAQPGKLTKACEQAFLAALSATANVRLSAAAAGASEAAFNRRRRRSKAFAREMLMALQQGYDTLEAALLEAGLPDSHADDAWRHNDPPAMPRLTPNQALQLLYLHQKEARLGGTPPALRRRPGESTEVMRMRLTLIHEARLERDREAYRVAEALRASAHEKRGPHEPPAPQLPDLSQVRGWSTASGKAPYREGVALFGGWRIEEMKKK